MYILTAAEPINKAKILLAQPYINNEPQSESPSGRHNRVDQLGTSTATSKAKASLAQLYINSDQQSIPPQTRPRPRLQAKYNWPSRTSIMSSKAKALLDDTVMSARAVYQARSAKRQHIWHSRISTAISRAKAHLAQQAMMGVYPHSGITNLQSENTTGTAVYQH